MERLQRKRLKVTDKNLDGFKEWLSLHSVFALDTETYGLDRSDRMFQLIISNEDTSYSLFVEDECISPTFLSEAFDDPFKMWFMHNAKFDMQKLLLEGVEIRGHIHCTMAMERLLYNNAIQLNLNACAKRRGLGTKIDKVKEYIKSNGLCTKLTVKGKVVTRLHYDKVPRYLMFEYGCQDTELCFDIGMMQLKELKGSPTHENNLSLVKVCASMEERGIRCDDKYVLEALGNEQDLLDVAVTDFKALNGESYKSSSKLFAKLFDKEGLKYPVTDKGNPSFKGDFLGTLSHPIGKSINKIKFHDKRISTYYSNFVYYMDKGHVIHAQINQGGTKTGRFSYSNPNLQNLPKEESGEYHIRRCFVPREGKTFYMLDYDQQEYRVMLDFAGEFKLINEILQGADVHQAIADRVGISRKMAKTLSFAILYGSGVARIAEFLKIDEYAARELKNDYLGRLPQVGRFITSVKQTGERRGYVHNFLDRKFYVEQRGDSYKLPNHLIQGTCADIMRVAMVRIHDEICSKYKDYPMLLQVHDELLFEMDNRGDLEGIKNIMEDVYPAFNGMKLTVSIESSRASFAIADKVSI